MKGHSRTKPNCIQTITQLATKVGFILACLLSAFPALAKDYLLKLTVAGDETGISIDPSEMADGVKVQIGDEPHDFGVVVIHGKHANKQLPLLSEGKPIEVNDRGEFQVRVEIKSERETLSLSAIENSGKIKTLTTQLNFPEWEEFYTLVLGKQKPTLNTGFNRAHYEVPFGIWTTSNSNSSKTNYLLFGTTHSLFVQGGLKIPKRTNQGFGILGNATFTYTVPNSGFSFPVSGSAGVKFLYGCLYDGSRFKISPFLGAQYERTAFLVGVITSSMINDGHQVKTGDFGSVTAGAIFYLGDPAHPIEVIPQISQSFVGQYVLSKQNTAGSYANTTLQLQARSSAFFKYFYSGARGQVSLLQGDVQTLGWVGYFYLGAQLLN